MINFILNQLDIHIPDDQFDQVFDSLQESYPEGEDPWGLSLPKARKMLERVWPLYKHYFKTRIFGEENVTDHPYMVVSNHSGQVAIDGMLITTAFATEINPPRILRSMVEKFFNNLPFIATWGAEGGAVLGDRQNCLNLLKRGESVLAFPEGVSGVAKSTSEYYQLQHFTRGFFRMSLNAGVDILPVAVIGAEEIFPWVYQAKGMAKTLGLPALPLSPLYLPLPSPVDIYIGTPYKIPKHLSLESPDADIDGPVQEIKAQIAHMIEEGLKARRSFWAIQEGASRK